MYTAYTWNKPLWLFQGLFSTCKNLGSSKVCKIGNIQSDYNAQSDLCQVIIDLILIRWGNIFFQNLSILELLRKLQYIFTLKR